jgi:hypothetical protein
MHPMIGRTTGLIGGFMLATAPAVAGFVTSLEQNRYASAMGMSSGVPFSFYEGATDFAIFNSSGGATPAQVAHYSSLYSDQSVNQVLLARLSADTLSGSNSFGTATAYFYYKFALNLPAAYLLMATQQQAPDMDANGQGSLVGGSGAVWSVAPYTPSSSQQLSGTLPAGVYELTLSTSAQNYGLAHFDFSLNLEPIPEPGTAALMLVALALVRARCTRLMRRSF